MFEKRPSRASLTAISLLFVASLAGCKTVPAPTPGRLNPEPVASLGQTEFPAEFAAAPTLHPNDVISVTVFREPDLSVDRVQVSADGTVSLPLVGSVSVTGKTAPQVAEIIKQRLTPNYLKYPQVTVNVVEYGSNQVTVEGAVTNAGLYNFKPGTRLSGAIALAGGTSRVAKLSEVAVFRYDSQGMLVAKFDYAAVMQGTMVDPILMPNDRVIVGTSGLSQFYQDLIKSLPAFALFTRL